ncbi:MAG: NAD-dependent epimerase/dehydratase family protein [Geminicoccaceae bacterium]
MTTVRRALVCGAGGFIGSHLVDGLVRAGVRVTGVDLVRPAFRPSTADAYVLGDLRDPAFCRAVVDGGYDELYQLAADMGGAGYIFGGAHDLEIMRSSALINLNLVEAACAGGIGRVFFASSACVYPARNQTDPERPDCAEDSAYPAEPDSEYGWEKLFAERLWQAAARNHGLAVRIGRLHNVYGPLGAWRGGREKAPAAICRKVAEAPPDGAIELWGDGRQTRSFLYVDECIEGILRLMRSDVAEPVNLGSAEMVTIDALARLVMRVAGKELAIRHVPGPVGVRGRTSDNRLIRDRLGWAPSLPLAVGIGATYRWIATQLRPAQTSSAGDSGSAVSQGACSS